MSENPSAHFKKNLNYSFKRARRSLKKCRNPTAFNNYQGLLGELQRWEERGKIDLYYFDESGFSQAPYLPYTWSPVNQPTELTSYPHSRRLNVLGFLSRQQKVVYHATEGKVTAETVIEAMEKLLETKVAEREIIVVLDNASVHRSKKVRAKVTDWIDQGLWLLYIPPYSPELNLIEILWKKIKYEWLPLDAHTHFEKLRHAVEVILSEFGDKYKINFV